MRAAGPPAAATLAEEYTVAFINSDGSEATKDMGQIAVENDGSDQGVQAMSLKEGLGRRANRLGAAAHANSGNTGVAINNSSMTQVAQLAAAGAGNQQTLIWLSLLALGGTAGTDFTIFQISWTTDDGAYVHNIYLPVSGTANIHLDGAAINTAATGQITVSARASANSGQTAFASLAAVNLPA
jgi:hypothetical protein